MDAEHKREFNTHLANSHGSFELVLSPVILGLGGWWLDGRLGTGPWLVIVAAVLGISGAAIKLYYGYRSQMDRLDGERRAAAATAWSTAEEQLAA